MNRRYTLPVDPENPGPTLASIRENPRANVAGCRLRRVKKGDYSQRLRERLREAKKEQLDQAQIRAEEA